MVSVVGRPEGAAVKACTGCGAEAPLEEFHRDSRSSDGRRGRCRACVRAYQSSAEFRAWRKEWGVGYRRSTPEAAWRNFYVRRCRRVGFEPVVLPFTRADLVERDGPGCAGCGVEVDDLQLHHRVPVSLGGSHSLTNVMLLCPPCNQSLNRGEVAEVRRRKAAGVWPYGIIPPEDCEGVE